ncbi:permease [Malonomonas rubra]|uniref:permease n=1 Tax=Malonomonas rubra TaxID=57040 RepID=UPI0026F0A036|nr:permease [Malonomonas rubra]
MIRQWLLLLTAGLYGYAFWASPGRTAHALQIGATTLGSVLLLIISVFGLVGLLQVWISRELIVKLLGREGGVKGLLIATFCGTVLIGPAYIIFPLLMSLHKHGARWAVVTIVLTSYAVKIQMIPIEVGFLGWPFSLARALITIALAIPTGLLVEAFMEKRGL